MASHFQLYKRSSNCFIFLLLFSIVSCTGQQQYQKQHLLSPASVSNEYFVIEANLIHVKFNNGKSLSVKRSDYSRISKKLSCLSEDDYGRISAEPEKLFSMPACPVNNQNNLPRLHGLKIAIDPGHSANSFVEGQAERKYISYHTDNSKIEFFEAELNMKTALILQKILESYGATVLNTRLQDDFPSKETFNRWLNSSAVQTLDKLVEAKVISPAKRRSFQSWDKKRKYIFFQKHIERPWRADKINAFKPDFSFMLHYNATGRHYKDSAEQIMDIRSVLRSKMSTSSKLRKIQYISERTHLEDSNYSMVFVPGSFMKGELDSDSAKWHYLRLLLSNDIHQSIELSRILIESFEKNLDIRPVGSWYGQSANNTPTRHRGVFARNLGMTRMVHGPLAFGEPFLQNTKEAMALLTEPEVEYQGISAPPIIHKTAQAYADAALQFGKQLKRYRKFN